MQNSEYYRISFFVPVELSSFFEIATKFHVFFLGINQEFDLCFHNLDTVP